MANATTQSGFTGGIPLKTNTTVVDLNFTISGTSPRTVLMMGRFNTSFSNSNNGAVVGDILVDGVRRYNSQLSVPDGNSSTPVVLFGTLNVGPGVHKFELSAFVQGLGSTSVVVNFSVLTLIDLG